MFVTVRRVAAVECCVQRPTIVYCVIYFAGTFVNILLDGGGG